MPGKKCTYVSETGFKCDDDLYRDGLCNKHWFRRYRKRPMDRAMVLTDEQVAFIQTSKRASSQLAAQLGVSPSRIRQIRLAYARKISN